MKWNLDEMMIHQPWSPEFVILVLDPSWSLVPHNMPALQEMSLEMLGRHNEFECGSGTPLLKKFRAQFALKTPKRHQRWRHQIFEALP